MEAQTVTAGESVTVDVASNFSDPDGNTLTFAAASSDDAVATASASGSNVTVNGVAAGTATITVTASDPAGLSATQSIAVTVEAANQAPVAEGTIDDQTLVEGSEATVDVAANFSDPDDDQLTYEATSSDTTVATVATSDAMVTVTAVAAGNATVTVTATDPDGLTATQEFGVTVTAAVNQAPVAEGTIGDRALVVGAEATVDVAANFSDPDDDELTYEATSSDTTVATVATSDAMVTVTAVAAGNATVTVTATDPEGLSATQTFDVTVTAEVTNHAPAAEGTIGDQALEPGAEAMVDVTAYFSDPDDDDLTYEAASDDEAVATVATSGAVVTVTAVAAGSAGVTVTATDPGGLSATQQFGVTVAAAADSPAIADTIPTHDVLVDSMVVLDVSPYFEGEGDLTYTATTSDDAVASASVDGSTVTTTGTGRRRGQHQRGDALGDGREFRRDGHPGLDRGAGAPGGVRQSAGALGDG